MFYDKNWKLIGSREELEEEITKATGISGLALEGDVDLRMFTVAQRMCWASKRETTRIEDLAYCLLGIFDVHMPLLYSEGRKPFIRLQEEIMKTENHQTMFVWEAPVAISKRQRASLPMNLYTSLSRAGCAAFL